MWFAFVGAVSVAVVLIVGPVAVAVVAGVAVAAKAVAAVHVERPPWGVLGSNHVLRFGCRRKS